MDKPVIEILSPSGRKRTMVLTGQQPITIGRDPTNALAIKDDRLSRFHCVIEADGSSYRVRDLQSRNGTRLNDKRVQQARLTSGDWLKVGRFKIRFVVDESPSTDAHTKPSDRGGPDSADIDWGLLEPPTKAGSHGELEGATKTVDDQESLHQAVDALANKPFDESAIALINARGQTVHDSDDTPSRAEAGTGGESVTVLRSLLHACFRMRATDLHVEPKSEICHVRVRVDGMMVSVLQLAEQISQRLLRVVKVLCDIDIAQSNIVQEGHFSANVPGRRVDFRVSLTPSVYGQKLVLRVLDLASVPQFLREMKLPAPMQNQMSQIAHQDSGMVLLCGPTGSGKTTTLYALLREIDVSVRNVITIEDPVEYQIDGVTQLPINESHGNSFSALLRSVLRQDPDVILVGEIRDTETATIALQAAMTGHLVLSTVHSRDAIGTIFRLLNLGVEPYMVATGLNLVVAQRLVRQLCPHCKRSLRPSEQQIDRMSGVGAKPGGRIYGPAGCKKCLQTAYLGRRATFEMLTVTDPLRDVILSSPQIQEIRRTTQTESFVSLNQAMFQMVADGVTAFEEVERIVGAE